MLLAWRCVTKTDERAVDGLRCQRQQLSAPHDVPACEGGIPLAALAGACLPISSFSKLAGRVFMS